MLIWNLLGTTNQRALVAAALDRCDFPWERLTIDEIPVEWADLSRWADDAAESGHSHDHDEAVADPLEHRGRVLGLAWYSGKVSLDLSLESDPELAAEVFLSEAAHMVDFFYMTDAMRVVVWNAVHSEAQDLPADADVEDEVDLGHGHGWFDVGGYYDWVGEAWMGLFVKGFSDFPVTIDFNHPVTDEAAAYVRSYFLYGIEGPDPEPPPPKGCLTTLLRWLRN